MTRNLKATKVIVVGDASQGLVSDAIKQVIEKERGITITEILEKENSIAYVKVYRDNIEMLKEVFNKVYFDKPKSKYHR